MRKAGSAVRTANRNKADGPIQEPKDKPPANNNMATISVANHPRRVVLRWGAESAISHAGQAVADVGAETIDRRQGELLDG